MSVIATIVAAWPVAVSAQAVPDTAPPTREEVERGRIAPADRAPDSSLTVEGGIERAPCALDDPRFKDIHFTLSEARFDGLRTLSPDLLREAWIGDAGKSLSVAAVCEIRDRAASILRGAGYLAAVQVPPQRIENGVVHFDVLLAKLVGVQVRGQAGKSEKLIAAYLAKITNQDIFNIRDAERYLLLARDLPGYDVRLTLRPAGTVPGEVIGEVAVIHTPVEVDANLQNYSSRATGRFGGLARVQFNGLTGLGDRTTFSIFSTADFEEQQVVEGGHSFRVGSEGLTLTGDLTYAWTRPDLGGGLDLRSRTLVGYAEASYPFVRSQTANLFGAAGFNLIDQRVRFAGVPLSRDHLRVVYARLDYDTIDPLSIASTRGFSLYEPRWRAGASLELRQGLDLFGASNRCTTPACVPLSRADGDPTAFVARASGYVEVRPAPRVAISVSPRAQYAPHALLSYEEYSAGNFTVGRGYDPGTLSGDSGLAFQSELRLGTLIPKSRDAFAFQPFGFFDLGVVWNEDAAFAGVGAQHLASAGGGVRAAWGDRARIDVALAVPLNRAGLQGSRGDPRLLISLTTKLVPWNR